MDSESGSTMEVAALGRPFSLGMLYDCRKDSLIPGKNSIYRLYRYIFSRKEKSDMTTQLAKKYFAALLNKSGADKTPSVC